MTPCSFVSVFHRFPEKFLPLPSEQRTVVTQDGRSNLLRNVATSLKKSWRYFAQGSNNHIFVILVKNFSQQLHLMGLLRCQISKHVHNAVCGLRPRLILLIHFLIQSLIVFHTSDYRTSIGGADLLKFPVSRQQRNFPNLCVIWSVVHSAESRSKNKKSLGVIKIGVTSPRYYLGNRSTCFRTRKYFCCLDQFLKFWWIWFQTSSTAI